MVIHPKNAKTAFFTNGFICFIVYAITGGMAGKCKKMF